MHSPLRRRWLNRGDDGSSFPLGPWRTAAELGYKRRIGGPASTGLQWRSRGAFGYFLTRDDLEKSRAPYLGDVVRRYLPHVRTEDFFTPATPTPMMDPFGGQSLRNSFRPTGCAPAVSHNGAPPMGAWAVNDFRPQEIEAVEVYRRGRMMPAEFAGWNTNCGLVVVWTQ